MEYLTAAALGREVSPGTQLRILVRQPTPHTGAASTPCTEVAQQFNLTVLLLNAWETSDIPRAHRLLGSSVSRGHT